MSQTTPNLPPVSIAFVIDGEIVDVLYTDERLAAIFLSEPVIVDVTKINPKPPVGSTYNANTKVFTPPPTAVLE